MNFISLFLVLFMMRMLAQGWFTVNHYG